MREIFHGSMSGEQRTACDVGRAMVKGELSVRKGSLDWARLPRRQPIAQARPWTLGEMLLAFAFTGSAVFTGYLLILGGKSFWHRLAG